MTKKIKVAITQGDINGIGYEIIIKALIDKEVLAVCTPIIYGSPKVITYYKKALKINSISYNVIRDIRSANDNNVNLINCNEDSVRVEIGKATKEAGIAAFQSLERAVADLKNGLASIMVTAPINKATIQNKDFNFYGHTEYLTYCFEADESIMLMVEEDLKIAIVTGHIPLKDVAKHITKENLIRKLQTLDHTLKYNYLISKPKIAVLGLNPHIGDNGLLGNEEKDVISPAILESKSKGILAMGPYSSDGFFGSGDYSKFDAILAMYHDQGLTPFKTLAKRGGVNFTAGLSIVRTSPAHGVAYGIAGKGRASEDSFKEAIYEAIKIYNNRKSFKANKEDKLVVGKKQYKQNTYKTNR